VGWRGFSCAPAGALVFCGCFPVAAVASSFATGSFPAGFQPAKARIREKRTTRTRSPAHRTIIYPDWVGHAVGRQECWRYGRFDGFCIITPQCREGGKSVLRSPSSRPSPPREKVNRRASSVNASAPRSNLPASGAIAGLKISQTIKPALRRKARSAALSPAQPR
jgi:hypothetical protein